MENKTSHIDQFFADKLHDLQEIPFDSSEQSIFRYLEQTKHPIDFALDKALVGLESEVEPFEAHEHVTQGMPEIDLSLHQRLKDYESSPDRNFTIEPKRKKRRAIWIWLSAVLVTIMTGLYLRQSSEDKSLANEKHDQTESTVAPEKSSTASKKPESSHQRTFISKSKDHPIRNSMRPRHDIQSITSIVSQNPSNVILEDNAFRQMTLKTIRPKSWQFGIDINTIDKNKTFHWDPLYRRFPISFHVQAAYINETGLKNQVESSNQHKDASDLFSQSTGKHRSGISISFTAEHNLGKNWKISTGCNYSHSSGRHHFDYYYTDIPVYDTTGALRGYLLRPRATTNHTEKQVISNSSSISIPLNIQYRILPFKKLSIWVGAGCQLALVRTGSGEYFNFKTEQISTIRQTFSKGILPQMGLGIRFPINMRWQLSSQFQVVRQSLNYQVYSAEYRRVELIPSFNIGLIYTPYIRIK